MIDEFTPYEYGMARLLNALQNLPEVEQAALLQLRLQQNVTHARMYSSDPSQQTALNQILQQLIALSLRTTEKTFNEWCIEKRVHGESPVEPTTMSAFTMFTLVQKYIDEIFHGLQKASELFDSSNKMYQFECENVLRKLQEPTLSVSDINAISSMEMIVAIHHIQHCLKEIIELIKSFSPHCEKRPTSSQRSSIREKLNDILQYMRHHKVVSAYIKT